MKVVKKILKKNHKHKNKLEESEDETFFVKKRKIINNKKIPNLIMCIIFKSKTHCLLKLYKKIKFLVFKKI